MLLLLQTEFNCTGSEECNHTLVLEVNETIGDQNGTNPNVPVRTALRLPWGIYLAIEIAMLASIFCLIATAFVYRRLPEFRNLPGQNLVTLSACLTLTYVFLFVDFTFRPWIRPKSVTCVAIASSTHISFVAVFAWTNVLAYDIWKTVTRKQGPTDQSTRRRYCWYAFYAWTTTALVSCPPLIQAWGSLKWTPYVPDPKLGAGRCWLNGQTAFLVYFNAPVGVALLVNFGFFIMTARTMIKIRNMTGAFNIREHKKRFHLYLKLFLVMGFVWLTEFLPLVTGVFALYAVAGFLTSLYGVALFVIFVCKAKVWKSLRKTDNLCCCCCWKAEPEWTHSTRTFRLASKTTLTTTLSTTTSENSHIQSPATKKVSMKPG